MEANICIQNNQLFNHQFESKDISEIKSYENICNDVDQSDKNEIHEPICSISISKSDLVIKSSILNTENLFVSRECSDKLIDEPSSSNDDDKSKSYKDEFSIVDLNVELLNGIHQHGIQELMTLQLKFMSFFINKRDIIFHSYPCIGKSTVCFISVLQTIDTNLNECQAVILVPTLELALSAQKVCSHNC